MQLFQPGPVVWIQRLLGEGWAPLMEGVSMLGATWGIVLALGLAFWFGGRGVFYGLLGVLVLEAGVNQLLTDALAVPRPDHPDIIAYTAMPSTSSFPSGHVATPVALASWLALSLKGRGWWVATAVVAVTVSVARVYLGVHYLADVVAGVALGLVIAGLWRLAWPPLEERLRRVPRGVWWAGSAAALGGTVWWALTGLDGGLLQWEAAGIVAGLAVAMPVEASLLGSRPGEGRPWLKGFIGVTGLVPLAFLGHWMAGPEAPSLAALAAFLGVLWAVLGAPALFERWR